MTFGSCLLVLLLAHHATISAVAAAPYLMWPPRRRKGGIYALLETWAFYFFQITWLLGPLLKRHWSFSPQSDPDDPRNTPVVFLHGYMMNRFCMEPLRLYLAANGFRRLYSMSLRRQFGSIETFAWQLRDFLFEVERLNPGKKILIVAHSMGGLVSTYALQDRRLDRLVGGIITLGTPFAGSELHLVGAGACARQFRPGGVFVRQLASRLAGGLGQKLISIYSDGDRLAYPPESSRVASARLNERLENLGHLSLLLSLSVFRKIYWHLFEWQETHVEHSSEARDPAPHP